MGKEILTFGFSEVEKQILSSQKSVDIKKIQVSIMVSSSKKNYKHFIGYKDDHHKVKPLLIMLPKRVLM